MPAIVIRIHESIISCLSETFACYFVVRNVIKQMAFSQKTESLNLFSIVPGWIQSQGANVWLHTNI